MEDWFERLLTKKRGGCWEWQGKFYKKWKKPFFKKNGKKMWAHRYAYEQIFGELPKEAMLYRLCWNDLCCNPDHMKPIYPGETHPQKEPSNDYFAEKQHMRSILGKDA